MELEKKSRCYAITWCKDGITQIKLFLYIQDDKLMILGTPIFLGDLSKMQAVPMIQALLMRHVIKIEMTYNWKG
jgi:hypothetical protein